MSLCAYRVKYLGKNGTDEDRKLANKQLEVGKVYTVYRIDIEDFETRVSLRGKPNDFNSVMFKPCAWIE